MSNINKTSKMKKSQKTNSNLKTKIQKTIAIAGNPNVGKSTVFNALTGLNQHTGNWPGKTVECAQGEYHFKECIFKLVDIPGTYSLMANSPEEEIARDFICFEKPDAVIVICDATCLERNLNLVLQILEVTSNVVVCVNLMDEARSKKLSIDIDELSLQLGVPAAGTNARSKEGLEELMQLTYNVSFKKIKTFSVKTNYEAAIESSVKNIEDTLSPLLTENINSRWVSLKLLENDKKLRSYLMNYIQENKKLEKVLKNENKKLKKFNIVDETVAAIIKRAEQIYNLCVTAENRTYDNCDRKIDRFLTSKLTGFPVMILLLMGIFWLTITGANYPSELIASGLFGLQDKLAELFLYIHAPPWIIGLLISGIYKTLAWVVSVMLPPMAIFFPLFTFLEDVGYLPRVAFNLDKIFKKSSAHGKQSLTMCMGFGCNACGIIGCRIIDSPRERLIAILTNNFVPCNGRFPLLISVITMFFIGSQLTAFSSLISTAILTAVIVVGIITTFFISKILSRTVLKGAPSSFILELPPYRRPQLSKILIRSLLDRTIFVLGRAAAVAAPAGLIIWIMANTFAGDKSILAHLGAFLDPFAKCIGLDGVILMAFILGFPANEIVFPIIIMSYMCTGSILSLESPAELHNLLTANGWNYITAVCVALFSLMHFPCGTTLWTIKKETGSLKWTALAFIIPTVTGIIVCFLVSNVLRLLPL